MYKRQDQGYLFGGVELPDNTALNVTADTAARIEKIIREDPGVDVVLSLIHIFPRKVLYPSTEFHPM